MRMQDMMTEDVKTIAPTAAAEEAWNTMRVNRIHHLVVTNGRRVVGVLSDRDAGGRLGASVRMNSVVADLMAAPAVTVEPTMTVRQAANVMRGRSIGCLVVAKSGHAIGIVTVSDLLELVGRGLDRGAIKSSRRTLNHRAPHRKSKGSWLPGDDDARTARQQRSLPWEVWPIEFVSPRRTCNVRSRSDDADGSIERIGDKYGSTVSFERHIGGYAKAFPPTYWKATSSVF
jgi:CBS domain-containing protein